MNSAPSRINRAATDNSEEIRNRALWTALRAITVKSPAKIAAMEKIQKKTASQPCRVIADSSYFRLRHSWCEAPNERNRSNKLLIGNRQLAIGNRCQYLVNHRVYLTVSRPCSSISRFQTNPARE